MVVLEVVGALLDVLFVLFVWLVYAIHKTFSRFPPMAADSTQRAEWLEKNCEKKWSE